METRHARHPYRDEVSELVADSDIDVSEIVSDSGHPAVERALKRISESIRDGEVDTENEHRDVRIEVMSYPVARLIVSATGEPRLLDRYSRAEAKRSIRFMREYEPYMFDPVELEDLFEEFGFVDVEQSEEVYPDGHLVAVGDYLRFAPSDDRRWSIRARPVNAGRVPLPEDDVYALIEEAIYGEIRNDLPVDVPDWVADALSEEIHKVREQISERSISTRDVVVAPDLFPKCMQRLYERARAGDPLDTGERTAIVAFLSAIGMDADDICDAFSRADIAPVETHIRNVANGGITPPGFGSLVRVGVCAPDECPDEGHPVTAYRQNLEAADSEFVETVELDDRPDAAA